MVLEDIECTSQLLEQVSKMGFDGLRPVLADHGLSEVGTLAELKARASKALEGRWMDVEELPVNLRFGFYSVDLTSSNNDMLVFPVVGLNLFRRGNGYLLNADSGQ